MVKAPFVSEPLASRHRLDTFDSGVAALDEWLRRSAAHAQANRTARTFVWHRGDEGVVAWFSLAASLVRRDEMAKTVARSSPEHIPAVLLARLALDRSLHSQGLGGELLADAVTRVITATESVAARLLIVDAIDERAAKFYERYGFVRVPGQLRLAQKLSDLSAAASPRA